MPSSCLCGATKLATHLLCAGCWSLVPPEKRDRFFATRGGTQSHAAARTDVLRALEKARHAAKAPASA